MISLTVKMMIQLPIFLLAWFLILSVNPPFSSAKHPKFVRRRTRIMNQSKARAFLEEKAFPKANAIVREVILPGVAGAVSFRGILALSTTFQKRVGITTSNPLAHLAGFTTVCIASVFSDRTVRFSQKVSLESGFPLERFPSGVLSTSPARSMDDFYHFGSIRISRQDVHAALLGSITFKLFRGDFWRIAPSSYTSPGSFAREAIPANRGYIGGGSKKQNLDRIYDRDGCHTCGSKVKTGNEVEAGSKVKTAPFGDHNPPISMGKLMKNPRYVFLPHCISCSEFQGSRMSAATSAMKEKNWATWRKLWHLKAAGGGEHAYNHGLQFRWYDLTGAVYTTPIVERPEYKQKIALPSTIEKAISKITKRPKKK